MRKRRMKPEELSPKTKQPKKFLAYTNRDIGLSYVKEVKNPVSYKQFREIMELFVIGVVQKLINDHKIFQLPYSMGMLFIKEFKNGLQGKYKYRVNFQDTKKEGKVIKHLNPHSFQKSYGLCWNKDKTVMKRGSLYIFKHTTSIVAANFGIGKRGISRAIRERNKGGEKSYKGYK